MEPNEPREHEENPQIAPHYLCHVDGVGSSTHSVLRQFLESHSFGKSPDRLVGVLLHNISLLNACLLRTVFHIQMPTIFLQTEWGRDIVNIADFMNVFNCLMRNAIQRAW